MELLKSITTFILTIVIVTIILAWPIQWLWNHTLVGAIDGVNPIGFWQALGINFLASILFKQIKTDSQT